MEKSEAIYTPATSGDRLHQGEIVCDLKQARLTIDSVGSNDSPVVESVKHPFAVVMTQDCDLERDFGGRQARTEQQKLIPNILFCETTTAESLREGADIKSDIWKRIRNNKDERYQFLRAVAPGEDALHEGLPDLAIDFRRCFTIPTDEVYKRLESQARRRCRLVTPYAEHLNIRFHYFQMRVALPAEHYIKNL